MTEIGCHLKVDVKKLASSLPSKAAIIKSMGLLMESEKQGNDVVMTILVCGAVSIE